MPAGMWNEEGRETKFALCEKRMREIDLGDSFLGERLCFRVIRRAKEE
jgi:hypothetical protein